MSRATVLGDTAPGSSVPATADPDPWARRWGPMAQRRATALAALGSAVTTSALIHTTLSASVAALWLGALSVLTAATGIHAGRRGRPAVVTPALLAAGVAGALACWSTARAHDGSPFALAAGVAVAATGTWGLLGWFSALGRRAGRAGALAMVVAVVCWELVAALTPEVYTTRGQAELGTVSLLGSVLALGLLPRLALSRAGLTGPDERRTTAVSTGRQQADAARVAAHREYAPATVVGAASATAGGWLALREPTGWTVCLVVLLAVVLCARAWAFPLLVEVAALLTGAVVLLLLLITRWIDTVDGTPYGPLLVLGVLSALPFALLALGPPRPLRRHGLRRMMNRVETAGTVALLPVALGAFGLYAPLLTAF